MFLFVFSVNLNYFNVSRFQSNILFNMSISNKTHLKFKKQRKRATENYFIKLNIVNIEV